MLGLLYCNYIAELMCDEDSLNNKDLFSAKFEAINQVHKSMQYFEKENIDKKLIHLVMDKKCTMIIGAKLIPEIRKIAKPSKPVYRNGSYEKSSKYHVDEEELLLWSLVLPNTKLVSHANERVLELLKKFYPNIEN